MRIIAKQNIYHQDVEDSVGEVDLERGSCSLDIEDAKDRPKVWQALTQTRNLAMQHELERKRSIPYRKDRHDRPKVWQAIARMRYLVMQHEMQRKRCIPDRKDRHDCPEVWEAIRQARNVVNHAYYAASYTILN